MKNKNDSKNHLNNAVNNRLTQQMCKVLTHIDEISKLK